MPTKEINYRPTSEGTPKPFLLKTLVFASCGRWVPVTESLPPEYLRVLVMVRGDNYPAYGWLRLAGGDRNCTYFVVPQIEAMGPRGVELSKPENCKGRTDVTHWYSPEPAGLPKHPEDFELAPWGLGGCGWETREKPLNPGV